MILGFLTLLIVGAQSRKDARSIALGTLCILLPMLIITCLRLAVSRNQEGFSGGAGMVIICPGLIMSVGFGYGIAASGDADSQVLVDSKKIDPASLDDEIA
ncbi:hypothetical protein ACYOEI_12670 [Singulisphaera rosea]